MKLEAKEKEEKSVFHISYSTKKQRDFYIE